MVDLNKPHLTYQELRNAICEKNLQIEEQNNKINDLYTEYQIQEKNLNKNIDYYRNNYNNIVNSKGWKIVLKIRNAIYKLKNISHKNNKNSYLIKTEIKESNIPDNDVRNYPCYNSHYEDNINFEGFETTIKAIAFYLPQYYTFPENDKWWGKNFTEWTNVKKATPKYRGHYQPRKPHKDFGYYYLDDINNIKKEINLAKQHGIYAFCYYYYWFSGKRLLEKPLDLFLKSNIDFPFMLCWANENWTRTWDGQEKEILIKQNYKENDPENFVIDIKKYIMDKRYIKINNKPVIMIYNPLAIPNLIETIKKWRKAAKQQGIGEIIIWTNHFLGDLHFDENEIENIDGYFDFAPNGIGHPSTILSGVKDSKKIYNYGKIVKDIKNLYQNHFAPKKFYYSVTMGWDNSPRRKENFRIYHNYSPEYFYFWCRNIINITIAKNKINERFIFINAWNEWGEGTYLEPDEKYGYTNINTLSKAIFNIPYASENNLLLSSINLIKSNKYYRIAIQIHCYYPSILKKIIFYLNNISYKFDLFISTNNIQKVNAIKKIIKNNKIVNVNLLEIEIFNNKGRDILPFILQMSKNYNNYDYICHLHTKKSDYCKYGDEWLTSSLNSLMGYKETFSKIINLLEQTNYGIISPEPPSSVVDNMQLGGNYKNLIILFNLLGIKKNNLYNLTDKYLDFPAGSMFISKTDAIKQLFKINNINKYFEKENQQIDSTMAHAIERSFFDLAKYNGYKSAHVIEK